MSGPIDHKHPANNDPDGNDMLASQADWKALARAAGVRIEVEFMAQNDLPAGPLFLA